MDDNPVGAPFPSSPSPPPFPVVVEDPSALPLDSEGGAWDWGSFLDFSNGDDDYEHQKQQLVSPLRWDVEENSVGAVVLPTRVMEAETSSRVRKRDPRLVCENYLAGRVPCACPEMEEEEEEEEEEQQQQVVGGEEGLRVGGVRKKARVGGGSGGMVAARCQVPGCEADIRELKGYHRRHRVCLRCANASSVMLDGDTKRYCQQCGKFHILTDFDEGKRSCRRKLERHNKRRRRRPSDSKDMAGKENEISENLNMEATADDDGQTKDSLEKTSHGFDNPCVSNKSVETDILHGPDKCHSPFRSEPSVHARCGNSIASFAITSDQLDGMDNPISAISSSVCENKSSFSTACPTGRISFKLYDWNPAEFPRRLRHQIFQWLASMPVELEGYIRPGCTILTLFIAMPPHMWNKLSKDAAQYLQHFVNTPDSLLFGRGNIHIHLNNTIFQVLQDGTSLLNVKMEIQVPKIHYVHPIIFEAGKAVEFFACGSNIFQPNFRFLVSFSGKYLEHELEMLRCEVEVSRGCEHQIYRIRIPQTEPELLGPAFIEVENDSGVSNFVPIVFVDKHIFPELQKMQQSGGAGTGMMPILGDVDAISNFCEVSTSRQSSVTELCLDIAWLLKKPQLDSREVFFGIGNIRRLNRLLGYLVEKGSVNILKKVLHYVEAMLIEKKLDDLVDRNHDEVQLFEKIVDVANKILRQKLLHGEVSDLNPQNKTCERVLNNQADIKGGVLYPFPIKNQEIDERGMISGDERKCLLIKNTVEEEVEGYLRVEWPLETCGGVYRTITNTRAAIFMMVTVLVCFGFCIALFHPHKAAESIISVRRCVLGMSKQ